MTASEKNRAISGRTGLWNEKFWLGCSDPDYKMPLDFTTYENSARLVEWCWNNRLEIQLNPNGRKSVDVFKYSGDHAGTIRDVANIREALIDAFLQSFRYRGI